MFLLSLDERNPQPKYRQILEKIRLAIESRALQPGDLLPSTRSLAVKLGTHRSTVSLAYQELWSLGFLDLRPGARARVRERLQIATPVNRTPRGRIGWKKAASTSVGAVLNTYCSYHSTKTSSEVISFKNLNVDSRLFPLENFRWCLTRAAKEHGVTLLGYGDRAGFLPLRESIAQRLQSHNIAVTADEILITNGSQHAIDLVFRMMASPGKSVIIESPTYDHMLPLLRLSGLRPREIPMRRNGMDLTLLEKAIGAEKPALVYTMPTFQNPTGVSTDQAHRERLLSICEQRAIPILEDAFEEEMKYFGKVVLPIKSMDTRNVVIYCGTFSKVLFPGIRIGWVAADRDCLERLMAVRYYSDLSTNLILQATMDLFCRAGYYDRHISKMHRLFRRRMLSAIRALETYISPNWAEWSEPQGGFLLWLKLKPPSFPPEDWDRFLASHGVQVAHGRRFFHTDPVDTYLRLSISSLNEEEIVDGVRRLSRALHHAYTGKDS